MTSSTALLETAFSPELPGDPLPPGPRANRWPGELVDIAELRAPAATAATAIHRLWRARGHHPRPDGTPTTVPRRAVPSAGGCYPVQWHLVIPPGRGRPHGPGRYVYDPATEMLVRRPDPRGPIWPASDHVEIVLTVQPGRTFGRYRHRAWPLWVADAAYALEALLFLVPEAHLPTDWSDLAAARRALRLPRAAQAAWWLDRGLVPELALARIRLPHDPHLDEVVSAAICARRSPVLDRFHEHRAQPSADRRTQTARQSGQSWVLGADRVIGWPRPARLDTVGYAQLWQIHREAARQTYSLAAQGHGVRAVSGFSPRPAETRPLVHAIAILENGAAA
ncbi:hypothetical protein [Nocardioides panzhihuensis]|uniref:Uncharacterized protein n=1 Tax=Nocardioides panzhihuensis TaxID=860243 RepID=A0A7Z0DLI6_9ACTN|nr:hypothetical protein [Nocardioides panzhihuensis]NYI77608.1 hypothetical protein [Nocardioides panzhihuensis]